jgi:hypothetical protein
VACSLTTLTARSRMSRSCRAMAGIVDRGADMLSRERQRRVDGLTPDRVLPFGSGLPRAAGRSGGSGTVVLDIEVKELPNESVLHFRYSASTRDRLRAIVSQEAACCAFLDLSLRDSDTELVLTLRAPAEARPIVADLIRRFRGVEESTARPRRCAGAGAGTEPHGLSLERVTQVR